MENEGHISISVRNIVEFILRSGNLDNSSSGGRELDAMQQGSKMHKKIQKSMADNYRAEFPLSFTSEVERDKRIFQICVEGRADGIVKPDNSQGAMKSYVEIWEDNYRDSSDEGAIKTLQNGIFEQNNYDLDFDDVKLADNKEINDIEVNINGAKKYNMVSEDRDTVIIDEIKCVLRDLNKIKKPVIFHRAQAMCYAYFYAIQNELDKIAIRISYCNLETEQMKYFGEIFSIEYLDKWYMMLLSEYAKWAAYQLDWKEKRNISIKKLEFPFEYRPGQKEIAAGVYRTIIRDKKLYIQAPTGVGKTISTIFPSVKAMGEDEAEKIFYLTAKTITRTAAEDTFKLLKNKGVQFKTVIITAKEKICILDKPDCNPSACERAIGHYDRVNDAVFDLINAENDITREKIVEYAQRYSVCPFEMCLDVSLWVDAVICDYNYAFDPNVYLRRFFELDAKRKYVFLIDEAHNLVDRACEMYSASLAKEEFLKVKNIVKPYSNKLTKSIEACNKELLSFKRECDEIEVYRELAVADNLYMHLSRLLTEYSEFLNDPGDFSQKDEILDLYFDVRHFVNMYENMDDDYLIYTQYDNFGGFHIKLNCMNPARNLNNQLKKGRSAIFFSATFLPINYYKEQLGGSSEDYEMYADSPFDKDRRIIMVANDVSTKYSRRNDNEYRKIAIYIDAFTSAKKGNYLVFFPSYQFMEQIYEFLDDNIKEFVEMQKGHMTEEEKEIFLEGFTDCPTHTRIGFCVMGGAFSEGIDLRNDRLIGVVVVGTGLPMVCNEREIFRGYYDDINSRGFDYAYLYNGMNKVLQAAGRVIRTNEDVGTILLLDDRFLTKSYVNLFPREWFPFTTVNCKTIRSVTKEFWRDK